MDGRQLDFGLGEVMERLERTRKELIGEAREIAVEIAIRKGTVSANDIREQLSLPETLDKRFMGAVFRCRMFERIDSRMADRQDRGNHPIGIYRLRWQGEGLNTLPGLLPPAAKGETW